MKFEEAWDLFLQREIQSAAGKRLELLQGDLVGVKKMFQTVLWPVFQTFDGFMLEYEVKSLSGVKIYIDAFYIPLQFAFEAEGFVVHAENITRDRFNFERMRVRTFASYGYKFMPFSWDELDKQSERCRRNVYEMLGKYTVTDDRAFRDLSVYEREIMRYALRLLRPFGLEDVCFCLGLGKDRSRAVLRTMLGKELVTPHGRGRQKIRLYELTERAKAYLL